MTTTFTIKQVPDDIAEALRRRAAGNRRSLQRELLLIIERAVAGDDEIAWLVASPAPVYDARSKVGASGIKARRQSTAAAAKESRKLSLQELWQRARSLGAPMPGESADLIRRDRDARHGR
jgi:plasmid stability protein